MPYIVAAKQQEAVGTSISIEVVRGHFDQCNLDGSAGPIKDFFP